MPGDRYNEGKLRYDLMPTYAQEQMVRVLTMGAQKYNDRNWEKGLLWMKGCTASLERHLAAFKAGEDHDPESRILHTAHIMANAAFLTEFYKTHPECDDRPHSYIHSPKIGLDVDEVIADFIGAYTKKFNIVVPVECWNFDPKIGERIKELANDREFYMSIKPKADPSEIPFEPHCYVTSRPIPSEWTQEWLAMHGFPIRPVLTVGHNMSKVQALKESGCDWFVDDRWENFVALSEAGVCCFLYDAPHNQRYKAGYKRIKSLGELSKFL